jgi:hypothetical protein
MPLSFIFCKVKLLHLTWNIYPLLSLKPILFVKDIVAH